VGAYNSQINIVDSRCRRCILARKVPEPATLAMMLLGFVGLGFLFLRTRLVRARASTA
jgi:hypothetical protein